ncbi:MULTISPECIES: MmgE/PrpD family protein [Streptomyces]|uniref:2-methylcitrate dehydratase n=1 Tax=Streptomyces canarius TaxID=285453 RepID=A0ABQ3DCK5_9ACTN|nr:MmgE/PrpD family protein [Streptomyces canarius]GHA74892.1 2-methylcitrate dehydratase [Streptomyces canarius]
MNASAADEPVITAPLAERIARWVTTLRYDDLPEEVRERTKLLILDQIGCELAGTVLPNVQPVLRLAERQPGAAQATLAYSGVASTVSQAAWVNGTLGHSGECDDAHLLAWHTTSVVVPAALALAEREGASGRDLITAVVAGVQTMALLGSATTPPMLATGWHGSKVLGVHGAAAAAGVVLGLTPEQQTNAFGIAGGDSGGTVEYDQHGGEVKRMYPGSAARAGVEAAQLAQLGFTGPPTIFDGKKGLLNLFAGGGDIAAVDANWNRWLILETIIRFFPGVATNHTPLDVIGKLRKEYGIEPADVARIRVGLVDFAIGHGASITRPTDAITAQFSLAFSIGLQFVTGHNAPADYFERSRWTDPEILAIADLVEPYAMPIPEGDPVFSTKVDIELRDGTALSAYQAGFPGHPSRPATRQDIERKFLTAVDGLVPAERAVALQIAVTTLEEHSTVREVTKHYGVPNRPTV